ncbi:MAG: metallophosphatase family protein [Gammaproteobacteria bacterium]|jgi:predicted phosphodiesterase|nr:metallophosphatase family protein [Gammaproteobacteria bacterium]MBU2181068.1 metallophosphatase family protein [Gammaproteobacteria bacterium]MBU2225798.1 metallophosphatase family protein [Gammaproteobacteria bacterium]MBU2428741.1 metallophosphatase family protein [Gammaproteobacteria bacterium]
MKIAILSDIHANFSALEAVLADAKQRGCTRFISLGDVAGYGAEPGLCINLLREHHAINLMGNHDNYLIGGSVCPRSRMVNEIIGYQRTVVNAEQLSWLANSQPYLIEKNDYFTHGGWDDFQDQYLYNISEDVMPPNANRFLTGHTHVQTLAHFGDRLYCNPGSVGQPRDGNPNAAYAVLGPDFVEILRVEYDINRAAAAMKAAGFPERYYQNLFIGAQIGGRIDSVIIKKQVL